MKRKIIINGYGLSQSLVMARMWMMVLIAIVEMLTIQVIYASMYMLVIIS